MHEPLFPKELWKAVNSEHGILQWDKDGKAVLVDGLIYERMVMKCHPYLAKIPTFANLRRQLRQYGFQWSIIGNGVLLKFWNPFFCKDQPELLPEVTTRRKGSWTPVTERYPSMRYLKKKRKQSIAEEDTVKKFRSEENSSDSFQSEAPQTKAKDAGENPPLSVKRRPSIVSCSSEDSLSWGLPSCADSSDVMHTDTTQESDMSEPFNPTFDFHFYEDEDTSQSGYCDSNSLNPYMEISDHPNFHYASQCDNEFTFCPFALVGFMMNYWGDKCTKHCSHPWHFRNLKKILQNRSCEHTDACTDSTPLNENLC